MRRLAVAEGEPRRAGFTIVELLVALVAGMLVLTSVVQLMIGQGRGYRKQREIVDVRETAREAAALLSWDLRQAAVAESPFATMATNSVALRSPQGLGTICAKHPLLARYGLSKTAGSIRATVDDTALVYQVGKGGWNKLKITAVGTPAAMGVAACAWPGGRTPDVVVEFAIGSKSDSSLIKIGAPFRNFRRVEYAEFQQNGRWWLGRKVGGAASYERLTGPLLPPTSNGMAFAYYDTLGAVTTNKSAVGSVVFSIRTESFKNSGGGPTGGYQHDSLTTKVAVRR